MRLLPPQRLRPDDYAGVEQALRAAIDGFVFSPLRALLHEAAPGAGFSNTAEPVSPDILNALRSGRLQYVGELFHGPLDAKLTRALRAIGAVFDARANAYRLPQWVAPAWLKAEAAAVQARAEAVHKTLLRELDRIQEQLELGQLVAPIPAGDTVEAIERGFQKAAESIGIAKRIPAAQRAAMEERYARDIKPHVSKATRDIIDGVHKAVTDNAARGYRFETMVEDLEYFGRVSERKARFLARQETGLFMAGYRRERFTAAGVTRYKWRTSHDIRVRPYANASALKKYGDHRELDGREFTYEQKAPAQYMSVKEPCNPGEDYNCRCVDLAIIE